MSQAGDPLGPDDQTPIQVDAWGVKVKGQPVAKGQPPPKTWREVGSRLHQHLKT